MKTLTRIITPPQIVDEKKLPDHRFEHPHEAEISPSGELTEQIERLVSKIKKAIAGKNDPIVNSYQNNNLYIEEIADDPSGFEIGSLLSTGNDGYSHVTATSRGHTEMDIPRHSVLGYAFTHPTQSNKFPAFADESSYPEYRIQLLRGLSDGGGYQFLKTKPFLDKEGVRRGFPLLFLVAMRGPYDEAVYRYLKTDEEKRIYAAKCDATRNSPLMRLF